RNMPGKQSSCERRDDMKWFSKMSKLINRDPKILPLKARVFCAFIYVFIGMTYIWGLHYIGVPRTLAACGIILGVFGAGVLYWETVADIQELQSVSYETDRFGRSSTNLSPSGFGVILVFAGLGFWCFI